MNKIVYAEFVFSIGSIVVYKSKPKYTLFGKTTYFWKYVDTTEFSGPFDSIMHAMNHCMKSQNLPTTRTHIHTAVIRPTNVVYVDFKKKKRIK
jgi:hypothetical protein